jgi:hypothetical protein
MLSVASRPLMLGVIMLNVVMLSVVAPVIESQLMGNKARCFGGPVL